MKILKFTYTILALGFLSLSMASVADVLELKSGAVLNGTYLGGTQATVRFKTADEIKVLSTTEILALTFTSSSASAPGPATAPAVTSQPVTPATNSSDSASLPQGTVLLVKTSEEVTTRNKKAGAKFSAILEGKLVVNNKVIAPAGATVYGEVLQSQRGGIGKRKAILEITLTQIRIDGEIKSIKTSVLTGEGEKGGLGRKIIKGAAVGALVDGSDGAEDGAKIGAGIGILAGGKHAGLAPGTVVQFTLLEPLSL